jgi:hypothetical protein
MPSRSFNTLTATQPQIWSAALPLLILALGHMISNLVRTLPAVSADVIARDLGVGPGGFIIWHLPPAKSRSVLRSIATASNRLPVYFWPSLPGEPFFRRWFKARRASSSRRRFWDWVVPECCCVR